MAWRNSWRAFTSLTRRWIHRQVRVLRRLAATPTLGEKGERAAQRYLRARGYQIVALGYRCRHEELDIVAIHGRTLVFVEVKTRSGEAAGCPLEAVDVTKQRRVIRAAIRYLRRHDLLGRVATRFDVLGVTWSDPNSPPRIDHVMAAFESPLPGSLFA